MSVEKLEFAQRMRANPTPAEAALQELLWPLRDSHGLKFRRQAPLLGWIADFYCPSRRVVIEADGPVHNQRADLHRDSAMQREHGILTLRYRNEAILGDAQSVRAEILRACLSRRPYRSGTQIAHGRRTR